MNSNSFEIICGHGPEELEKMDSIFVNGVEFVPMTRLDAVKAIMGGYLEDAHRMVRARDGLIRDMWNFDNFIPHETLSRLDMHASIKQRIREFKIGGLVD